MDAKKNALRAEDITKGVLIPVSNLPKKEPKKAVQSKATLPMATNQWNTEYRSTQMERYLLSTENHTRGSESFRYT